MKRDVTTSVNGTIEDVAAFFRVSIRTVSNWMKRGQIGHFKEAHNVMFGIEDVVAMKCSRYVTAGGMRPGEAEDRARREWLEHLQVQIAELRPYSFRLPKNGELDPWFGCTRTFWAEAIRGSEPEVSSWLHRRHQDKRGIRLIDYASARAFIERNRSQNG